MIFKATLDKTSKIVTIGILILFLAITIGPLFFSKTNIETTPFIILAVLLIMYFVAFSFSTKSYEIVSRKLFINRPFNRVEIDKSEIKSVCKSEYKNLSGSLRTFGSGGLFGYYGKYWSKELGKMNWYATNMNNVIVITTNDNKKIVITPDNTNQFLKEFESL